MYLQLQRIYCAQAHDMVRDVLAVSLRNMGGGWCPFLMCSDAKSRARRRAREIPMRH